MIQISGLEKSYQNVIALKNINLEIADGDIFGLVGLSGAGKSTLLRCMSGLEVFEKGKITINGIDVKESMNKNNSILRKNTGMIFQHFSLLSRMTIYENVALPMKCWKYKKDQIDKRVKELLSLVGLEDKMYVKPAQLSGGQKQRVAIARALTMQPDVLFCDEATSALDPFTTESILDLLKSINKKLNVTIIVVTHEMSVAKSICNKIAILTNGEICDVGNTEDIFLEEHKSLRSVLGEQINGSNMILPGDIKVIFHNMDQNKKTIYNISNHLEVAYMIVWSSFDLYRGEVKGYYIFRVQEKDRQKFIDYMKKEKIEFTEVEDHA